MERRPHPFTLRQLQYAVAVADTRNFRRAAELCRVAQPSLSAQLSQLEDALGVRLFERTSRGVLVTAAGEAILDRARKLLVDGDDLVSAARHLGDPLAGTLRLGVIPTISPYLLPAIVPALRKRHPRLNLVWTEDRTSSLVAALDRGGLDAALLALEADIGELDHEVIAIDPFVLAAPREHPLGKSPKRAHQSDLAGVPVLLLDDGHCFRDQSMAYCGPAGALELGFRATSLSTLTQMVASGTGVTLLPQLAVPAEVRRAKLTIRQFAEPQPHRTIALVWRPSSPMAPALREITATMRDAYPRAA
jgi:LysR family hydrogen peroxide-inducible transcriptional activator